MRRIKILVTGKVQGVYFRQSMLNFVAGLHVTGFVRNLPSGQVSAEIQGKHEDLEAVLTWCSQGPTMAKVLMVEQETIEYLPEEKGFAILR